MYGALFKTGVYCGFHFNRVNVWAALGTMAFFLGAPSSSPWGKGGDVPKFKEDLYPLWQPALKTLTNFRIDPN